MPTVFITNRSGHDFSPAEYFGELVYLSSGKINPYQTTKMYKEFSSILNNSKPDDYILITGLSIMNSIATACMAYKHGRVNILQWHEGERKYKRRQLMLGELLIREEGGNNEKN